MPADNSTILLTIKVIDEAMASLDKIKVNIDELASSVDEAGIKIDESGTKIDETFEKTSKSSTKTKDDILKNNEEIAADTKLKQEEMSHSGKKLGNVFNELGAGGKKWGIPLSETLGGVGNKMGEVETKSGGLMQSMSNLGKVSLVAGGALASGVAYESIKSAMAFQTSTNQMAGAAGISISSANKIGQAFLSTGGSVTFSGSQIMQAYSSVAGQLKSITGTALNSSQAMGVMNASMDMAEATGESLSSTTSALGIVMQSYHLNVNQAANASNIMYESAKALGVPISMVAQTFQRLKTSMGMSAPSINQTGTLLLDLSQHGESGRRAMMALSAGMSSLLSNTPKVIGTVAQLGMHLYNSTGKFVGMKSIIEQLQPKLKGMNTAQRMLVETQLLGARGALALNNVIMGGAAAYDKAKKSAEAKNAAEAAAQKVDKSFQAQIELMKTAIEDFAVKIGQKLIPILSRMMKDIRAVFKWMDKHREVVKMLAVVIGTVLATAIGVYLVNSIREAVTSLMAAQAASGPWGVALMVLSVIIMLIITHMKLFKTIIGDVAKFFKPAFEVILTVIKTVWNFIKDHWKLLLEILIGPIGIAVLFIVKHFTAIKKVFMDAFNFIGKLIGNFVQSFEAIENVFKKVFGFINNLILNLIHTIISLPTKIIGGLEKIVHMFADIGEKAIKGFVHAFASVGSMIMKVIKKSLGSVGGIVGSAATAIGLAEGGIVTRPTLAVVGEAGPEAVVPLKGVQTGGVKTLPQMHSMSNSSQSVTSINIDLRGSTTLNSASMQELANKVGQSLTKQMMNRGAIIKG